MAEESALAVREANISDLQSIAKLFAESGYFPDAKSMAQAFVKIQAGRELGIPAMAAMTGIAIIQGKPVAGANIIAAKVKTGGYDYRIRRLDNTGCKIEFFTRAGESLGFSEFTDADAKAAGLTGKDNWRKYARNMYFARAISNGQRWYCPDATQGQLVYTPDELGGAVTPDGEPLVDTRGNAVMDAEFEDIKPTPAPPPDMPPEPPAASYDDPFPTNEPPAPAPIPNAMSDAQYRMIFGQFAKPYGVNKDHIIHQVIADIVGRSVSLSTTNMKCLTKKEASVVIDALKTKGEIVNGLIKKYTEADTEQDDSLPF